MTDKTIIITGIVGLLWLYLIRQIVNGALDRWAAFRLNVEQLRIAADRGKKDAVIEPPSQELKGEGS